MPVTFRTYINDTRFGEDYHKLRDFLICLDSHNYHFGRWDWMITHGYLDESGLEKIGLWEDGGKIIAAATYDCSMGSAYLLTQTGHEYLKEDMLVYAKDALAKNGDFRVLILDGDTILQDIAAKHGLFATEDKECDAVYPIGDLKQIEYSLPEGFSIISFAERPDAYEAGRVMWKGFNHEANGEGPYNPSEEEMRSAECQMTRINVNPALKIAVTAPDGHFASFCGMWQDDASQSALVEPVATDPAYRKLGLGRAAVLEAVRRCGELGAKRAFVGSSQQFYYCLGFRPYATSTWWKAK